MSYESSVAEYQQSILKLLRSRSERDQQRLEVIITTAPQLWDNTVVCNSLTIDVARLFEVMSPWAVAATSRQGSRFEEVIYQQFLNAGWPAVLMQLGYRPSSRSPHQIDIAIFDILRQPLMAVEIIRGEMDRAAAAEQVRHTSQFRSVCVTDGKSFTVFNRENTPKTYEQPPAPELFGIVASEPNRSSVGQSVVRPANTEALRSVIAEHAPSQLVIDFTFPWRYPVVADENAYRLLPDAIISNAGDIDMVPLILAWAASVHCFDAIAVITASALTWTESYKWLRAWITQHKKLAAHIELPHGVFGPMNSIRPSYLRFDNAANSTYFDSVANRGDLINLDDRPWFQSYVGWLNGKPPETGFARQHLTADFSWTVARNDPQAVEVRKKFESFGPVATLDDIAMIRIGRAFGRGNLTNDPTIGSAQIIDNQWLRSTRGEEAQSEIRYIADHIEINEVDRLCKGDVLVPRVRSTAASAIVFQEEFSAIAAGSVVVLRPVGDATSEYIAEFLNSAAGRRLLDSVVAGGGVPQIQLSALRKLPIPLINVDFAEPLSNLQSTQADLADATSELTSRREELFDSPNLDAFLEKFQDLQRRAKLLTSSLKLADSLEFQISQLFPFPIAYSYRLLAGYVNPRELLQEQLRVAENVIAFLGSISVALLEDKDRLVLATECRNAWERGISPGSWRSLLIRASNFLEDYKGNQLASSVCALSAESEKKALGKELKFLISTENDYKHDRGPKTESEFVDLSKRVQESLDCCMSQLVFMTGHPIRQVRELDAERQPGWLRLQCLNLAGDHPGFRQEEVRWQQALKKCDLYLEETDRRWIPLYPFIQRLTCRHCKAEETYFVDVWDGRNKATMKSFERGHTEESHETAASLEISIPKPV